MKSVGIVRKIDHLGRVVIPKELRRVLHLDEGASIEIMASEEMIVLKRYRQTCSGCGSAEKEKLCTVHGLCLCTDCISRFREVSEQ